MSLLDFMNYFWVFLILHFIADFPLQGEFLANMKGKYDYLLFAHSIIWAGVIMFGLMYFGKLHEWHFFFLWFGHYWIDRWKARKADKTFALTKDLWIDQGLHFIQLAIVILF
jgi:hypothetical protein